MRILEESEDRLLLAHRPWAIGLGIAAAFGLTAWTSASLFADGDLPGGVMIGLGALLCLGAGAVFVRPATLLLDRTSGQVTYREAGLLGSAARSRPLSGIAAAEIARGRWSASPGAARGSRAILRADDGSVFTLASAHMSHRDAARAVAAVNRWLAPS